MMLAEAMSPAIPRSFIEIGAMVAYLVVSLGDRGAAASEGYGPTGITWLVLLDLPFATFRFWDGIRFPKRF